MGDLLNVHTKPTAGAALCSLSLSAHSRVRKSMEQQSVLLTRSSGGKGAHRWWVGTNRQHDSLALWKKNAGVQLHFLMTASFSETDLCQEVVCLLLCFSQSEGYQCWSIPSTVYYWWGLMSCSLELSLGWWGCLRIESQWRAIYPPHIKGKKLLSVIVALPHTDRKTNTSLFFKILLFRVTPVFSSTALSNETAFMVCVALQEKRNPHH